MEVTFIIDKSQTNQLKRKLWRQKIRFFIPIVAFVQLLVFINLLTVSKSSLGIVELIIVFIASCFFLTLALWLGVYMSQQLQLRFELELNDSGVKTEMRNISWNHLQFKTNKEGDLILFDSSINRILRWWNGQGTILVPKELKNFEEFSQLIAKATTHNNR
ncbi:MAG: hypothetical protein ACJA2S_005614 [Cyclobacteriaceae bacterium]|jgi:hypothetical protein